MLNNRKFHLTPIYVNNSTAKFAKTPINRLPTSHLMWKNRKLTPDFATVKPETAGRCRNLFPTQAAGQNALKRFLPCCPWHDALDIIPQHNCLQINERAWAH